MPTAQEAQAAVPPRGVYFPAGQVVHAVEPATEDFPTAQEPQKEDAICAVLYLPAGQFKHTDAPLDVWNLPMGQSVQPLAPAREYVPKVHLTQSDRWMEPETVEKVPAAQLTQLDAPVAAW